MNLCMLLVILTYTVMSYSGKIPERVLIAKRKWEKILKKYETKKAVIGPNQPQNRFNRHAHRLYNKGDPPKTTTTTTTTTRSPLDIKREEEAKKREKNPKNVPSLEKDIKRFKEELKKVEDEYEEKERCTTNNDCRKRNGTCCMTNHLGEGVCQELPTKLNERCSELCPCGDSTHECKIPILTFIRKYGQKKYNKKCINKNQVEYYDVHLKKILSHAKRRLNIGPRVPRDSKGRRGPAKLA